MKRYAKRRGFTLVELLIVIVVIGILSAMMMLSSTEAVSSAKAAKIISDLRQLKTAALAWYVDNLDLIENSDDGFTLNAYSADILKYLGTVKVSGNYEFSDTSNNSTSVPGKSIAKMAWFVWWKVEDDKPLLRKLANRGQSVKLRYTHIPRDCNPSQNIFDMSKLPPAYGGTYTNSRPNYIGLHIRGKWGDSNNNVF